MAIEQQLRSDLETSSVNLEILEFREDGVDIVRSGELDQRITSVYGDLEWSWDDFVLRVGGRRERVDRDTFIPANVNEENDGRTSSSTESNIFGASASYSLSNGITFLAGYSTTVARPIVKELLPFPQIDRETGQTILGNPDLEESSITNADFAITFPQRGAFSGQINLFHKRISNPILRFRSGSTIFIDSGEEGTIAGVEVEGRMQLPFGFTWDANFALIQGDLDFVSLQDGASLSSSFPEQPSHIFNTSLNYKNEDYGLNANLALNVVSPFVEQLPINAGSPFLERQPAPQLDFSITKSFDLGETNLIFGFSVENLLSSDDLITFISDDEDFDGTTQLSIDRGRRFSFWGKAEF